MLILPEILCRLSFLPRIQASTEAIDRKLISSSLCTQPPDHIYQEPWHTTHTVRTFSIVLVGLQTDSGQTTAGKDGRRNLSIPRQWPWTSNHSRSLQFPRYRGITLGITSLPPARRTSISPGCPPRNISRLTHLCPKVGITLAGKLHLLYSWRFCPLPWSDRG